MDRGSELTDEWNHTRKLHCIFSERNLPGKRILSWTSHGARSGCGKDGKVSTRREKKGRHEPLDFGRSQSFHGTLEYRSAAVYWFCFRWIPRVCRVAEREEGGEGETLKRGERDYKGGDAVTPSYSRVKRKSWKREFGLERRTYVTTPSLLHRADETRIPRVFRSVHSSGSSGWRVKRDKTNLGRVQRESLSLYLRTVLHLLSRSSYVSLDSTKRRRQRRRK